MANLVVQMQHYQVIKRVIGEKNVGYGQATRGICKINGRSALNQTVDCKFKGSEWFPIAKNSFQLQCRDIWENVLKVSLILQYNSCLCSGLWKSRGCNQSRVQIIITNIQMITLALTTSPIFHLVKLSLDYCKFEFSEF